MARLSFLGWASNDTQQMQWKPFLIILSASGKRQVHTSLYIDPVCCHWQESHVRKPSLKHACMRLGCYTTLVTICYT